MAIIRLKDQSFEKSWGNRSSINSIDSMDFTKFHKKIEENVNCFLANHQE